MQRRTLISGVVAGTLSSCMLPTYGNELKAPLSEGVPSTTPEVIDSTKLRFDNAGIDIMSNEKEILAFIGALTPGRLVADTAERSVFHIVHEKWRTFSRAFQDQFAVLIMNAVKDAKQLDIDGPIPPIAGISVSISSSNSRMFTIRFGKDRLLLSTGRKLESVNIGYTYEGDVIIDSDTAKVLEKKGIRYSKEEKTLYLSTEYFVLNYGGGKTHPEILEAHKMNTPLTRISLKDVIDFRFERSESLGGDIIFLNFRGNDEMTVLKSLSKGDSFNA